METLERAYEKIPETTFFKAADLPGGETDVSAFLEAKEKAELLFRYGSWLYKPSFNKWLNRMASPSALSIVEKLAEGRRLVFCGLSAYNGCLGLTTQMSAKYQIACSSDIPGVPPTVQIFVKDLAPFDDASLGCIMVLDALEHLEKIPGEGIGAFSAMVRCFQSKSETYPDLNEVLEYSFLCGHKVMALAGLLGDRAGGADKELLKRLRKALKGTDALLLGFWERKMCPKRLLEKWNIR